MNKINIDGVLIVEGKEDVSYLSSFLNALFFTTNGYDVNKEKIEFLKLASTTNKLIIFSDSDDAGESIRNKLKSEINGVFEAKCQQNYRKNYKKKGIAESTKESIVDALKEFVSDTPIELYNYDLSTLVSLSTDPEKSKRLIINKYRLIEGNLKSIQNQLNILRVKPHEIREFLNGN